jgi:hypothetical protein
MSQTSCSRHLSRAGCRYSNAATQPTISGHTVFVSCKLIKGASASCDVHAKRMSYFASLLCLAVSLTSVLGRRRKGMKQDITMHFNSSLQYSQPVPLARESHCPGCRSQWFRVYPGTAPTQESASTNDPIKYTRCMFLSTTFRYLYFI